MSAIILENVGKRFRRVTLQGGKYVTLKSFLLGGLKKTVKSNGNGSSFSALKDISFTIKKGESLGIIGRNGSGKSTLLKLVAGIYTPDAGRLDVNGRVSALIELGAGFHPEFSGRENIFINASILGMTRSEIRDKFDTIVTFAGLWDFIDNPVRTYSSGMFMRLGFSVAIHADPDILLVDEVLAVGDEAFSHKCKDRINEFRKTGKTIVVVTHSMGDVERLCDRVVWLEEGAVKQIGPPRRVIDAYITTVAELENKVLLDQDDTEPRENEEATNRWGTREGEITKVVMKGADGAERYVYHSGDTVIVEIDYLAHVQLEKPVFGIAINKQDGSRCYGTNTDLERIKLGPIQGPGKVIARFDSLNLVEESYTLSVALHARDGQPYDYHDQMYKFSIRSPIKDVGVFRPPHGWTINGVCFDRAVEERQG